MEDLTGKIDNTAPAATGILPAAQWNQLPQEVQNIITAAGQSLSNGDLNQLGKGIAAYVGTSDVYVSSGPADAYILTPISGYQGPPAYFDGMRVRFVPNVANTGASVTVNVNGLGVRTVVREDGVGNSSNNEYKVGIMVELRYDDGAGNFKLRRIENAGTATNEYGLTRIATQTDVNLGTEPFDYVTPETLNGKTALENRRGVAEIATQTETNTGTDDTRIVTPLKLATRLGLLGSDDIGNDSTVPGATVSDALEAIGGVSDSLSSDTNISSGTATTIMSFTVVAATTYRIEGLLPCDNLDVNTLSLSWSFGTATSFDGSSKIVYQGTNFDQMYGSDGYTSTASTIPLRGTSGSAVMEGTGDLISFFGHVRINAGGTLNLQAARATGAGTIVLLTGGHFRLVPVT